MNKHAEFIEADDVYTVHTESPEKELSAVEIAGEEFLRSALGGDSAGEGQIIVKKQTGSGKNSMEHVESFPLDKYSFDDLIEYIRKTYGSGDYRFYIYQNNEAGKSVLKGNKLVSISKRSENIETNKSDENTMVTALREQSTMLREIYANSNNPQQSINFDDMLTRATAIAAVASPFILAWLNNRPKAQDPMKQFSQFLTMTGDLRELNPVGDNEDEDSSGLMAMAGKFFETMQNMPRPQVIPGTARPVETAATPGPGNINPPNEDAEKYARFAPFLNVMLQMAEKKPNPRETALSLAKSLNDENRPIFADLLAVPELLSFLIGYNSAFALHIDWVNDFIIEFEEAFHASANNADLQSEDNSAHNVENSNSVIDDADITQTDTNENGATVE